MECHFFVSRVLEGFLFHLLTVEYEYKRIIIIIPVYYYSAFFCKTRGFSEYERYFSSLEKQLTDTMLRLRISVLLTKNLIPTMPHVDFDGKSLPVTSDRSVFGII
jgi:hypothetical protein